MPTQTATNPRPRTQAEAEAFCAPWYCVQDYEAEERLQLTTFYRDAKRIRATSRLTAETRELERRLALT